MDLSVITVTYNNEKVIKEFLDSFPCSEIADGSLSAEVVIIDNNSQDRTVPFIKHNGNFAKLIESNDNVGFSAANNLGLRKSSGKLILFLNPDTYFSHGIFSELIDYMKKNDQVGAVTVKILQPDGSLDPNTVRKFPTPWQAFCHFMRLSRLFRNMKFFSGYYVIDRDERVEQEISACGGSFLMVKREIIEQIGGWDEDYFLYGEDLDCCYRIRRAGWKIMYYPKVSVTHYGGVSTGIKKSGADKSIANVKQRKRMADYSVQAMEIFYRKHLCRDYNLIVNAIVFLGLRALRLFRRFRLSI